MEPVKVRAKGLAIAIHFDDENYVEKIGDKCEKAGLIVSVKTTLSCSSCAYYRQAACEVGP